jgi:hypothetical protein
MQPRGSEKSHRVKEQKLQTKDGEVSRQKIVADHIALTRQMGPREALVATHVAEREEIQSKEALLGRLVIPEVLQPPPGYTIDLPSGKFADYQSQKPAPKDYVRSGPVPSQNKKVGFVRARSPTPPPAPIWVKEPKCGDFPPLGTASPVVPPPTTSPRDPKTVDPRR